MGCTRWMLAASLISVSVTPLLAQQRGGQPADDAAATLVGQLDLEAYKATIKGLTQFGDRREGTQRNRDAVDWIAVQLESYGYTTERLQYDAPAPRQRTGGQRRGGQRRAGQRGGQRRRGARGGRRGRAAGQRRVAAGTADDPVRRGAGNKGFGGRTGVNNDPERQPNVALRELNMGPVLPGPRDVVYCTKIGTTNPDEMYIIGAHMDGIGYGEAANDDGSGTAIVMELARLFGAPGVTTEKSIRFVLWNGEEGGLRGSRAYVAQRSELQGIENPPGSGNYPEPKWLGMIQHDMMMWDHGAPKPDGKMSPWQRPEADVNIEFQVNSEMVAESQQLAWYFEAANHRYATDYPANVGQYMQSTDSAPFQDYCPAICLRENERRDHIGSGWDRNWYQPTDVFITYTDADFRLGLNAAQTTLAAVAQLAGAKIE